MVEMVLHIGMGKTGTSSIQETLNTNRDALARQGTDYLGMWFQHSDGAFVTVPPLEDIGQLDTDKIAETVDNLAAYAAHRHRSAGIHRFILSNEGIYGHVLTLGPLIEALRRAFDLRLVAYVRSPRQWLPSAYNQWGIYHKVYPGRVRPYAEMADKLTETYSGLWLWAERHGDILTLRPFRKQLNVVDDFAALLNLTLDAPRQRKLERVEVAESVLRAIYNDRFDAPALPQQFDNAIGGLRLSEVPQISRLLAECFTYEATEKVLQEKRHVFDRIRAATGLDLLAEEEPHPSAPDEAAVRGRLLEQLVYLTLTQADRVRRLEEVVRELQFKQSLPVLAADPLPSDEGTL